MRKNGKEIVLAAIKKEARWKVKLALDWPNLVGKSLANLVFLQGLDDDRIIITAKNACLAQELRLQSDSLCRKFNEYLGKPYLSSISIKIGSGVKNKKAALPLRNVDAAPTSQLSLLKQNNLSLQQVCLFDVNKAEGKVLSKIKCPLLQASLKRLLLIIRRKGSL